MTAQPQFERAQGIVQQIGPRLLGSTMPRQEVGSWIYHTHDWRFASYYQDIRHSGSIHFDLVAGGWNPEHLYQVKWTAQEESPAEVWILGGETLTLEMGGYPDASTPHLTLEWAYNNTAPDAPGLLMSCRARRGDAFVRYLRNSGQPADMALINLECASMAERLQLLAEVPFRLTGDNELFGTAIALELPEYRQVATRTVDRLSNFAEAMLA